MIDYFLSTARYYKQYRPFYPQEVLEQIQTSFGLSTKDRVLDIGAGTGQLAIGLAPSVKEVVAVEPDHKMISYGKELAAEHDVENIRWIHSTAENLSSHAHLGQFTLATFGASFHWMDQEELLKQLDKIIEPDGGIVVTGSKSVWHPLEVWEEKVKDVIVQFLGKERRAGTGKFQQAAKTEKTFQTLLQESPFSHVTSFDYRIPKSQTTDEVIGRIFSTSFANPAVLGDKKEAFEKNLRDTLTELNPDGIFEKTDEYYLFVAKRSKR